MAWKPKGGSGGGGGASLPISANDVTETTSKKFLTQTQKDQITFNQNNITNLQNDEGKVKSTSGDTLDYLSQKTDNITIEVVSNKLVVKSLDGLIVGVSDLNTLQGITGNVQTQIDNINTSLSSIASGMEYKGQYATYSAMDTALTATAQNGWLVVIQADETKTANPRTMYVYNDSISDWDFLGEFEFTDEFIKLTDTPNDYIGHSGKVIKVKSTEDGLVFGYVDWSEIANGPTSAPSEIDDAVAKKHSHSNLAVLNNFSEDSNQKPQYRGMPIGGVSGGGHEILDEGTSMTQRPKLEFQGFNVSDDSTGNKTIIAPESVAGMKMKFTQPSGSPISMNQNDEVNITHAVAENSKVGFEIFEENLGATGINDNTVDFSDPNNYNQEDNTKTAINGKLSLKNNLSGYTDDLTSGQTYFSTPLYNQANPASFAFNDNTSDIANLSGKTNNYIGVQYSTPRKIRKVRLFPYVYTTGSTGPYHWKLEASNDNVNWTKINAIEFVANSNEYNNGEVTQKPGISDFSEVLFDNDEKYEYYRVFMYDNYDPSNAFSSIPVAEIEMMEELEDYEDSQPYFTITKHNVSKYQRINTATVNGTEPAGTGRKYLVSFDSKAVSDLTKQWKYESAGSWYTTPNGLDDLQSLGMTTTQYENALTDYAITDETVMHTAIELSTTDPTLTPTINSIVLNVDEKNYYVEVSSDSAYEIRNITSTLSVVKKLSTGTKNVIINVITDAESVQRFQSKKLNITASVAVPYVDVIETGFKAEEITPPVEVLKFVSGGTDVVSTLFTFDNSDSTDFEPNEYVTFDGNMKPKTNYQRLMTDNTNGTFSLTLDESEFKNITSVNFL